MLRLERKLEQPRIGHRRQQQTLKLDTAVATFELVSPCIQTTVLNKKSGPSIGPVDYKSWPWSPETPSQLRSCITNEPEVEERVIDGIDYPLDAKIQVGGGHETMEKSEEASITMIRKASEMEDGFQDESVMPAPLKWDKSKPRTHIMPKKVSMTMQQPLLLPALRAQDRRQAVTKPDETSPSYGTDADRIVKAKHPSRHVASIQSSESPRSTSSVRLRLATPKMTVPSVSGGPPLRSSATEPDADLPRFNSLVGKYFDETHKRIQEQFGKYPSEDGRLINAMLSWNNALDGFGNIAIFHSKSCSRLVDERVVMVVNEHNTGFHDIVASWNKELFHDLALFSFFVQVLRAPKFASGMTLEYYGTWQFCVPKLEYICGRIKCRRDCFEALKGFSRKIRKECLIHSGGQLKSPTRAAITTCCVRLIDLLESLIAKTNKFIKALEGTRIFEEILSAMPVDLHTPIVDLANEDPISSYADLQSRIARDSGQGRHQDTFQEAWCRFLGEEQSDDGSAECDESYKFQRRSAALKCLEGRIDIQVSLKACQEAFPDIDIDIQEFWKLNEEEASILMRSDAVSCRNGSIRSRIAQRWGLEKPRKRSGSGLHQIWRKIEGIVAELQDELKEPISEHTQLGTDKPGPKIRRKRVRYPKLTSKPKNFTQRHKSASQTYTSSLEKLGLSFKQALPSLKRLSNSSQTSQSLISVPKKRIPPMKRQVRRGRTKPRHTTTGAKALQTINETSPSRPEPPSQPEPTSQLEHILRPLSFIPGAEILNRPVNQSARAEKDQDVTSIGCIATAAQTVPECAPNLISQQTTRKDKRRGTIDAFEWVRPCPSAPDDSDESAWKANYLRLVDRPS